VHEWKILKDFRHIEWLLQSAKWSNQQKSRENHSIWMKQTIAFPWKEPPSPNTHLQASFAPTPAALLGLVSAAALSWPLPGWLASQESVGDHGWLCLVGLGRWFSEWIYGVCVYDAECMWVPLWVPLACDSDGRFLLCAHVMSRILLIVKSGKIMSIAIQRCTTIAWTNSPTVCRIPLVVAGVSLD
jgi:hypothetical protein